MNRALVMMSEAARQQWRAFKSKHPGCVLFFRVGATYELFEDDARLAHRTLGIALTERSGGMAQAGVPEREIEIALRRMIVAGHRCAVADLVPKPAVIP